MAKKNFSFICDHASVTSDGKLNINGIFEYINSKNFPFVQPVMYMVINISGVTSGNTLICELSPKTGDGKKLCQMKIPIKVEGDKRNFGFIGQLVNIVFEKPGEYVFRFLVDGKDLPTLSLVVNQI